jgi:hypothetical protein
MRRSLATVLVVVVFLLLAGCSLPGARANEPPTRILDVQYPQVVRRGSVFTVRVQVYYSARFGMMDVGVWDLDTRSVVQNIITNATLSGRGQGEYSLSIRAPQNAGRWHLAVITRAWVQDAWFNDKAGEFEFSVAVAEDGFLVVDGIQPNSTVFLDGRSIVTDNSTLTMRFSLGTVHRVGVSQLILLEPGRRLVFTEWSDGVSSNPREILMTGNMSISPVYKLQYLLVVNSDVGVAAGGGWYQEGGIAQFGVSSTVQYSPVFFGLLTDSQQFTKWSGDSASTDPIAILMMDGPRRVDAQWTRTSTSVNLNLLVSMLIVTSVPLAARAGYRRMKQRGMRHRRIRFIRLFEVFSLVFISIMASTLVPVLAELPTPVNASLVNIGGASWYYWNKPESDTCILWLGGGVEYSQGGYLINPLEYESFGTIRFLQDLTQYYCLVALEKGPNPLSSMPNRTIYQELVIQGEFSVAKQLHQWINGQGYKHIFLIGYSVGTDAAALIATSDPQTWTNSDGLILITAWLPPNIVNAASSLNSNLMLLYGHAPVFEPTGFKFYQNAPSEGWHGTEYLHKEFHLLDQMGHEVWSPLEDNTYNSTALGITVSFIQTSNALQFSQVFTSGKSQPSGASTYVLSQVETPSRVLWNDPFFVSAVVSSPNRSNVDVAVAAYDFRTNLVLSVNQLNGSTVPRPIRLVMPSVADSSELSFSLLVLERHGKEWEIASNPYAVTVSSTDLIIFRVSGLVPTSDFIFDQVEYVVPQTGQVQLETLRGTHSYRVQGMIDQNRSRYLFVQWDDSNSSTFRSLSLTEDTSVNALYRVQYSVTVLSPVGIVSGSGWYDANSTFEPTIQPVANNVPPSSFDLWRNDHESYRIGDPITVNSPMILRAVWTQPNPTPQTDSLTVAWVTASALMFSLLLLLNAKVSRRIR